LIDREDDRRWHEDDSLPQDDLSEGSRLSRYLGVTHWQGRPAASLPACRASAAGGRRRR
jgi:hypothetical protein